MRCTKGRASSPAREYSAYIQYSPVRSGQMGAWRSLIGVESPMPACCGTVSKVPVRKRTSRDIPAWPAGVGAEISREDVGAWLTHAPVNIRKATRIFFMTPFYGLRREHLGGDA